MHHAKDGLWSTIRRRLNPLPAITLTLARAELVWEPMCILNGAIAVVSRNHVDVDLVVELLIGAQAEVEHETCVCCNVLARFQQLRAAKLVPGERRLIEFEVAIPRKSVTRMAQLAEACDTSGLFVLASLAGLDVPTGLYAWAKL